MHQYSNTLHCTTLHHTLSHWKWFANSQTSRTQLRLQTHCCVQAEGVTTALLVVAQVTSHRQTARRQVISSSPPPCHPTLYPVYTLITYMTVTEQPSPPSPRNTSRQGDQRRTCCSHPIPQGGAFAFGHIYDLTNTVRCHADVISPQYTYPKIAVEWIGMETLQRRGKDQRQ